MSLLFSVVPAPHRSAKPPTIPCPILLFSRGDYIRTRSDALYILRPAWWSVGIGFHLRQFPARAWILRPSDFLDLVLVGFKLKLSWAFLGLEFLFLMQIKTLHKKFQKGHFSSAISPNFQKCMYIEYCIKGAPGIIALAKLWRESFYCVLRWFSSVAM